MATATKFDVEALRSGQEGHDADVMTDLYKDDAESTTVDTSNPPSRPRVLRGKEEIAAYWNDVMHRGMKHTVEKVVVGDDAVAYQVACQYDDGTKVLASVVCDIADDGKIPGRLSFRRGIASSGGRRGPRAEAAPGGLSTAS